MLKKDVSIKIDKTIIWEFSFIMLERSFTGKKPPDEINVKAKFKELKDLIENKFRIKEISLKGKKPPDDIKLIAKFNELNDLIPINSKIIKINIVNVK